MKGVSFARSGSSTLPVKRQTADSAGRSRRNPPKAANVYELTPKTGSRGKTSSSRAAHLEALLRVWIAAGAAMVFLLAIVLTVAQVLSLMQLFYVYAGITVTTFLLGLMLYLARSKA